MTIDFYYAITSPPCRTVLLLAKNLGVEMNIKPISVQNGDNKTAEFLKMNPQHCIPTIVDNGFVLWESRAILSYLVNKYGKDDSLYPKDPKKKAVVDQRLYFELGTLYPSLRNYFMPILQGKTPDHEVKSKLDECFGLIEKFLEGKDWVAGDNITVADYCIAVTVSNTELMKYDFSKYKNVSAWMSRVSDTIVSYDEVKKASFEETMKYINANPPPQS